MSSPTGPAAVDRRPRYPLANLLELDDGRTVEWEAIGEGEPLLWIEGGPGLPAHLARPDVRLLGRRFRSHLVNAPGSGRTSPPETAAGYGLAEQVRFFDEVRRSLGLGPVTIMGHSWGGLVALALAIQVPSAVRRLILIDAYAGEASVEPEAAAAERDRAWDRIRDRPWFDDAVATFAEPDDVTGPELDERFKRCWPLYFAEPDSAEARPHVARLRRETRWNIDAVRAWSPEPALDYRPQLEHIRCPTLVIVGEHDFICGPSWNRPIASGIPGATYAEIPGVGHIPHYEAPEEVRAIVEGWLDRDS